VSSPTLVGDDTKREAPYSPDAAPFAFTARYLCCAAKVAYDRRRPPVIKVFVRTQTQGAWVGYAPETKMDGRREKTQRLFANTGLSANTKET